PLRRNPETSLAQRQGGIADRERRGQEEVGRRAAPLAAGASLIPELLIERDVVGAGGQGADRLVEHDRGRGGDAVARLRDREPDGAVARARRREGGVQQGPAVERGDGEVDAVPTLGVQRRIRESLRL